MSSFGNSRNSNQQFRQTPRYNVPYKTSNPALSERRFAERAWDGVDARRSAALPRVVVVPESMAARGRGYIRTKRDMSGFLVLTMVESR